jgi:hypothetical protein
VLAQPAVKAAPNTTADETRHFETMRTHDGMFDLEKVWMVGRDSSGRFPAAMANTVAFLPVRNIPEMFARYVNRTPLRPGDRT